MAFNQLPTAPWPGYHANGTRLYLPLADLDGLTADQSDPVSGDWRAIIVALYRAWWRYQQALDPADRPAAAVVSAPSEVLVLGDDTLVFKADFFNTKNGAALKYPL